MATNTTMPPEGPPIRKKNVRPNKMVYFDAQGVRHEIHIPTGTYERATALFVAKDWDELAKFPVWGESSNPYLYLLRRNLTYARL